ncbi:glycoside hydrolase family 3 protein [Flammeovirga agarivorans]|uniref:beta-N-acetylhexosaminidase n=1 Tax=Flammeovirga agarivorans TaxID=2726742 RepID=A0A7X8SHH8_9BACT|nr:glycoside hydrolase family 3 protein [Flammeovirga agarivorans]NLR90345.1 glycoside hydrolase family 3 protein [Flammeovirga agarivorans]
MNYFKSTLLIASSLLIGCSSLPQKEQTTHITPNQAYSFPIDESWKELSIREKVGQVICFNYSEKDIEKYGNGSIKTFLSKYPIGSSFLANWSVGTSPEKFQSIAKELQKNSKYPLLLSEDFESGLGEVIKEYTYLPGEMSLGAAQSPELAHQFGKVLATEARSLGINWVLNPVADINLNPSNFLTNSRSTGDQTEVAIKVLPHQINGLQSNGVVATAKHFPGDGTDVINQHFATSSMQLSMDEWYQEHGKVFQTVINEGVQAIMPGHITFPAYQKEQVDGEYLPATLSSELLQGLLKKEMGFNGVVVSDALNMAGITNYYPNQLETEVACFVAGCDILLWPSLATMDTIVARVERGIITMDRLDDAVQRVWRIKTQQGLFNKDYQACKNITKTTLLENKQTAQKIADKAITLIANKHDVLPIKSDETPSLLFVYVSQNTIKSKFKTLKNELQERGYKVDEKVGLSYFANAGKLQEVNNTYDKILFIYHSKPNAPWGSLLFNGDEALSMWSSNMLPRNKVVSIGVGDPYKNILYLPQIWSRINVYNDDPYSQRAIAKAINGEITMNEHSPVLPQKVKSIQ